MSVLVQPYPRFVTSTLSCSEFSKNICLYDTETWFVHTQKTSKSSLTRMKQLSYLVATSHQVKVRHAPLQRYQPPDRAVQCHMLLLDGYWISVSYGSTTSNKKKIHVRQNHRNANLTLWTEGRPLRCILVVLVDVFLAVFGRLTDQIQLQNENTEILFCLKWPS